MTANFCTVSDTFIDGLGKPAGGGRKVFIAPLSAPLFVQGVAWNQANNGVSEVIIKPDGTWSVDLPYPVICDPSSVTFAITMPDGTTWSGTVPSAAGSLTLHDLMVTYSWASSATVPGISPSAVTQVSAADGTIVVGGTRALPTLRVGSIAESQVTNLVADLGAKATTTALTAETTRATAAETNNTTAIASEATTARAAEGANASAISAETTRALAAEALLAPKASPTFTGTMTVPASVNATDAAQKAEVTAEATARATAVTGETTRATAAEATKLTTANNLSELTGTAATARANLGVAPILNVGLIGWTLAEAFVITSATRDSNEAITTASVVWPDGSTGTFTTDTASTAFPGAIDAYHVTYVPASGPTKTVTQTAVTRDAGGAVTTQPALTVT